MHFPLMLIVAMLLAVHAHAESADLQIHDAWIAEAPPAARMLAGYLELSNPGPAAVVIVDAESAAFANIEIHRTVRIDGVARMRRQTRIEIAPGETVRFEPGGLHLMLMRPTATPTAGDNIELRLLDDDGNRYGFTAQVRRRER